MLNRFFIIFLIFTLGACTGSVNKHWNCDAPKGQGCSSIEEADNLSQTLIKDESKAKKPYFVELEHGALQQSQNFNLSTTTNFIYGRTKESEDRIWFAPFIDIDGNQHEESYVRVITKTPKWVVSDEIN